VLLTFTVWARVPQQKTSSCGHSDFVQRLSGDELASVTLGIELFVLFLLCRPCYRTASTLTTQSCLRWPPPHFLWLLYTAWLRCLVVHGTSASSRTGSIALCFLMFCYQPLLRYHFLTACTPRWLSCQEGAVVCTWCAENSAHLGAHLCRSYPTVYTACMQHYAKCSVNGHADTTALLMQGSNYSVGPCDHLHRLAWL